MTRILMKDRDVRDVDPPRPGERQRISFRLHVEPAVGQKLWDQRGQIVGVVVAVSRVDESRPVDANGNLQTTGTWLVEADVEDGAVGSLQILGSVGSLN